MPVGATAGRDDGAYGVSRSRSGACCEHGGVERCTPPDPVMHVRQDPMTGMWRM